MHLLVWIIGYFFLIDIHGNENTCLHIHTRGKHCTSDTRSVFRRNLIQPTTMENQECYSLCIQSGYRGGGHCSVTYECFRFCSCHHFTNSTFSLVHV